MIILSLLIALAPPPPASLPLSPPIEISQRQQQTKPAQPQVRPQTKPQSRPQQTPEKKAQPRQQNQQQTKFNQSGMQRLEQRALDAIRQKAR